MIKEDISIYHSSSAITATIKNATRTSINNFKYKNIMTSFDGTWKLLDSTASTPNNLDNNRWKNTLINGDNLHNQKYNSQ